MSLRGRTSLMTVMAVAACVPDSSNVTPATSNTLTRSPNPPKISIPKSTYEDGKKKRVRYRKGKFGR